MSRSCSPEHNKTIQRKSIKSSEIVQSKRSRQYRHSHWQHFRSMTAFLVRRLISKRAPRVGFEKEPGARLGSQFPVDNRNLAELARLRQGYLLKRHLKLCGDVTCCKWIAVDAGFEALFSSGGDQIKFRASLICREEVKENDQRG